MSFAAAVKKKEGFTISREQKFTDSVEAAKSQNIIMLIQGDTDGFPAWYYLSVSKLKYPLLKDKCGTNAMNVDLKTYGEILHCGWGSTVPEAFQAEMKAKYNFS